MENQNEIIEITVKAILLGDFNNWQSWIAHINSHMQKNGVTHTLIHIDANGYSTNGYNIRNTTKTVYPVKTYRLLQDPDVTKPTPFKSPSNN